MRSLPIRRALADPTGAGDAFCGGFLAGYRQTYDPVQAVLHGSVSASLVVEGSGAFLCLGCTARTGTSPPGSFAGSGAKNLSDEDGSYGSRAVDRASC